MRLFTLSLLAALLATAASPRAHADSMPMFDMPHLTTGMPSITEPTSLAAQAETAGSELALGSVSTTSSTPAAATPEPSSVLLLGTGLLSIAIGLLRKRFKARQVGDQRSPSVVVALRSEVAVVATT